MRGSSEQIVAYGISRWNNPSRPRLRHVVNPATNRPWCEPKQRVLGWEKVDEAATCKKCQRLFEGGNQ